MVMTNAVSALAEIVRFCERFRQGVSLVVLSSLSRDLRVLPNIVQRRNKRCQSVASRPHEDAPEVDTDLERRVPVQLDCFLLSSAE